MDNLRVLDIRLQNNGRPLKAFADIQFHGLEIRNFRVIQQPGDRAYIAAPQTSWKGQEGKLFFKTIISMPDVIKSQIQSTILAEYYHRAEESNHADNSG